MIEKKHCTIELVCGCNLSCRHCYLPAQKASRGKMDPYNMAKILDRLADEGFLSVSFTGDEPLLDPWLPTYIALAKERRFLITLKTNGTLITPALVEQLTTAGVSCVHVSVYSADAREHDTVTGVPGSHERTLSAIRLFLARRVRVRMLSPLLRPLVDLASLHTLARSFDILWLPDPVIYSSADHRPEVEKNRLSREDIKKFHEFMLDQGLYYLKDMYNPRKKDLTPCGMGTSGVVIDSELRYRSCIRFVEAEASVLEIPFEQIVETTLRTKNSLKMRSVCRDCELRFYCQPCPALALREDGDLYGCSKSKRLLAEVVREIYRERGGKE